MAWQSVKQRKELWPMTQDFVFVRIAALMFFLIVMNSCVDGNRETVEVRGGEPPHFIFSNADRLAKVLVCRIPPDLVAKQIPASILTRENPDMMWWVEGKSQKNETITYGVVPDGMSVVVPANPLIEDQEYFVF